MLPKVRDEARKRRRADETTARATVPPQIAAVARCARATQGAAVPCGSTATARAGHARELLALGVLLRAEGAAEAAAPGTQLEPLRTELAEAETRDRRRATGLALRCRSRLGAD